MEISDLSKEQLVELLKDFGKRWLAHDGLWFQAIERKFGIDNAIELDIEAWEKFTVVEARRIMKFLGLEPGGGLDALEEALKFRLYSLINKQSIQRPDDRTLLFYMNKCRVQDARKRKGLQDFACKPVGLVEYTNFAKTIDERIRTEVIACPPDEHPEEFFCGWKFTLEK